MGLFGSVARGDAHPDSDIDLAVRFADGMSLLGHPGGYSYMGAIRFIEGALGRHVDMGSLATMSPMRRESAESDLLPVY